MKTPYLIGSIIGMGIVAKATVDLSNVYERRKYAYLKCINKSISDGVNPKYAKLACNVEAWNSNRLPPSINFLSLVALIPALILGYELFSGLKER